MTGTSARQFLLKGLGITAVALALAGLAYQLPILQRASLALQDMQVLATTRPLTYSELLVIDVDEASIAALASQLGPWPYDRDVYALVNEYLRKSGAKVVAYDILFAEPRNGDEQFAASLAATGNAVLIASELPQSPQRNAAYLAQISKSALPSLEGVPAQLRPDITPPVAVLSDAHGVRLGINTVVPDSGSVVRRVPLIHDVYGKRLPSLQLAVLLAANPDATLSGDGQSLSLGAWRWPLTSSGEVELRFPKSPDGIPQLSFYKLVLAALGADSAGEVASAVRGKTIFVGSSTAILGDYVETPLGRMAGLFCAALIHQMLAQGSVLEPARPAWDTLLFLMALAIPLAAFLPRVHDRPYAENLSGIAMVLVVTAASTALISRGQQAALLFPLLTGVVVYLAMMLMRLVTLSQEKRQLDLGMRAAQEAHRLNEQFMSHISHELRTPLTAIMGYNKFLADPALAVERRIQFADVVDKNSQHLLSLVNNILDQSRIQAGQMKIVPAAADLHRLVGDVLLTLAPGAKAKNLALESQIPETLPAGLMLDPMRVKQVLINLLGNAIKFTELGKVRLECDWQNDRLTLAVSDTGPGMTAAQVERIFSPFAQAHDGIAQTHGGSGLGLSISRMLCDLMGGEITVASQPGHGTTFTASITAAACTPPVDGESISPPAIPAKLVGRILIADDNDDIRDLVELYLTGMGLAVLMAENGRQAVAVALSQQPDLVLMDMEMPDFSGLEAVAALRQQGFTHPIMMLTGHVGEAQTALAKEAGCDMVLTKPVDRERLQAAISKLLRPPVATP